MGVLEFFVDLGSAIDCLSKIPGSRLVIVGDGREKRKLEDYAKSRGLDQRVEFVGRVPYEQIGRWISSMDICLLPFESSELTEAALPLKIHEYSALHRPIIANLLQCIQEACNVYHSSFTRQPPSIIDLFVYWYPKRGVVHVHVNYISTSQPCDLIWSSVGGIPVPAVEEEPQVLSLYGIAELEHTVHVMDEFILVVDP